MTSNSGSSSRSSRGAAPRRHRRGAGAALALAACCALLGAAAASSDAFNSAALAAVSLPTPPALQNGRKLQQGPFPKDAFDRSPMTGAAHGKKAGGQPEPVSGLVNPDIPSLSKYSASMEGESTWC